MKTISLHPPGHSIEVPSLSNLLDSLLAQNCQVAMACGGEGICATCHVYVRQGMEALSPVTAREKRTLALITGANACSRLACQAQVVGQGLIIDLPEGLYLQTVEEIVDLVGRRTQIPILHPSDGRILIPKGKIITRSRILELEREDLTTLDLREFPLASESVSG